jgi:hypothetical protein
MRISDWKPSLVPRGENHDVYLVVDDLGKQGRVWRETKVGATDFESVVTDMLEGQYSNPVRVICFNITEGWSRDVSEEIIRVLQRRCEYEGIELPASVTGFMDRMKPRA